MPVPVPASFIGMPPLRPAKPPCRPSISQTGKSLLGLRCFGMLFSMFLPQVGSCCITLLQGDTVFGISTMGCSITSRPRDLSQNCPMEPHGPQKGMRHANHCQIELANTGIVVPGKSWDPHETSWTGPGRVILKHPAMFFSAHLLVCMLRWQDVLGHK